ncbi:hypothetical protein AX16_002499 [Volvariella volvacea WC 439]|nr:hypothetical protein AX16_002499 [Volvariella volvacea WC 439]
MSTTQDEKAVLAYIVSQELVKFSSLLPSNKNRSIMVHSLINSLGLLSPNYSSSRRIQVITPRKATYRELISYHSREYMDYILDPENASRTHASRIESDVEFGLEDDCPPFPGLPSYVELVAGATLTAVEALCRGIADVAVCWDGGRHHAHKSHASGFCYVADCILALMTLKRSLPPSVTSHTKSHIMYLDLDLHFSDAVSQAFCRISSQLNPQILTLSIHHAAPGFFPASPLASLPDPESLDFDPFTLSIPLRQGASSKTYKRIWSVVESIRDAFEPDCIVVQCGLDGLSGDPCGTFNWSLGPEEGSLGWCVGRIINKWPGRKLLLGGGGYNSSNAARGWAYLTSIALCNPYYALAEGSIPFTSQNQLDVPSGTMPDSNTENDILLIEERYQRIIDALKARLA